MVVNNYYYSNPPASYPKSTDGVEVHNFVANDAVSDKKVISPEAKVQDMAAQEMQNDKGQEQAAATAQTQVQKSMQEQNKVKDGDLALTGLGANLNVLA